MSNVMSFPLNSALSSLCCLRRLLDLDLSSPALSLSPLRLSRLSLPRRSAFEPAHIQSGGYHDVLLASSPMSDLRLVVGVLQNQSICSWAINRPSEGIDMKGVPPSRTWCMRAPLPPFLGRRHLVVSQHRPHCCCSRRSMPVAFLSLCLCPSRRL